MVTYCELEAVESVVRFHSEPTVPHSASSQNVCAPAAALKRARASAGSNLRRKLETSESMGSPFVDDLTFQIPGGLAVLHWLNPRRDSIVGRGQRVRTRPCLGHGISRLYREGLTIAVSE